MKEKPLEHTAPLFLKECQMTTGQVGSVEVETRGQSANDLWNQYRIGFHTWYSVHTYHTKAQSFLNIKRQNDKKACIRFTCVKPAEEVMMFLTFHK